MSTLARISETRWRRRVLELATLLAQEPLAPDLFHRFLTFVARDLDASSAVLDYDAHDRRTEFVAHRFEDSAMRAYSEHFHAINPFTNVLVSKGLYDRSFLGSDWVDANSFLKGEYYNDFLRPRGERYFLSISISYHDGGRTGIPFYRGDGEGGDFQRHELRRLDMLRPFLKNALFLRRLQRRYELASLPVVKTIRGALRPCNAAAEEELRAGGRLERATMRVAGGKVALPRVPLSPEAIFRRRYGLSARESEVAALLCHGLSYEEVAARLEISPHTVNSHVKSILRKLNLTSIRRLPPLLFDAHRAR